MLQMCFYYYEPHHQLHPPRVRQRITRSCTRLDVVAEYVDGDLVGLRQVDDYTRHVLSELTPPEPHLVQQSWARLLNCLASFTAGRTYLCG